MYKCVTSEYFCEISNLIHEEVLLERRGEGGLLQAMLKKNPWLLKKLLLATHGRQSVHCDVSEHDLQKRAKTKGANVSSRYYHFKYRIFSPTVL